MNGSLTLDTRLLGGRLSISGISALYWIVAACALQRAGKTGADHLNATIYFFLSGC